MVLKCAVRPARKSSYDLRLASSCSGKNDILQKFKTHSSTSAGIDAEVKGAFDDRCESFARVYLTICTYAAFFGTGLVLNAIGTTLVHMGLVLDEGINAMAFSFSASSAGLFIGSIISGFVYEKFDKVLQFCIGLFLQFCFAAAAPWLPNLYGYLTLLVHVGASAGFIVSGVQVYLLDLWVETKWKNFNLYMMNAIYCVGAFVCPLIAKSFLVELSGSKGQQSDYMGSNLSSVTLFPGDDAVSEMYISNRKPEGIEMVRFAFLAFAALLTLPFLLFLVGYLCVPCTLNQSHQEQNTENTEEERKPLTFYLSYGLLLVFYICEFANESVMDGFLIAFVIDELEFSIDDATTLKSVYWIAFGISNVLIIPLSLLLSGGKVLAIELTLASLSLTAMIFVHFWNPYLMYIAAITFALGDGAIFAACILFVASYFHFGGRASAVIIMGGSLGSLSSAPILGYLYNTHSPMFLVYFCLTVIGFEVLAFANMIFLFKAFAKHNRSHINEIEIQIASVGNGVNNAAFINEN